MNYPYSNSEFFNKENYEVMSNFPAEQDLEKIYGKAALLRDFADEFYQKGMIDSAQVYYAKSALLIDPTLISNMYPEIKVINKIREDFERFMKNKDSMRQGGKNMNI